MKIKTTALVAAVTLLSGTAALAAESTSLFTGADTRDDSNYFYLGGIKAISGDLDQSGWLLRGVVGYGEYEYQTTAVPSGEVDVDQLSVQAGVGYQRVVDDTRLSFFTSVDYQDHDDSPADVMNSVRGDETGVAFQAEIDTTSGDWNYGVMASYSTAFDSYWSRARVGYNTGSVTVGPELVVSGNEEYAEERYGVFVGWPLSAQTSVTLSGGYFESEGDLSIREEDGGYASLGLSYQF